MYIFNKRNEYSTVFDDKKLLEKKVLQGNNVNTNTNINPNFNQNRNNYNYGNGNYNFENVNNERMNNFNNNMNNNFNNLDSYQNSQNNNNFAMNSQTQRRTPVKTNVMPTTNLAYGAYYNSSNYEPNNKIIFY